MAPVGGRAADVVDRARGGGDLLGKRLGLVEGARTSRTPGAADPNAARISPRSRSATSASEQTAITIAFRGPTFMNVCGCPLGRTSTDDDQLVRLERVPLDADEELVERKRPLAAHARELDLGALDEQRRKRVARRRGRAEVAADRAAVADLRRADRARRLGQRGQLVRERSRIASV